MSFTENTLARLITRKPAVAAVFEKYDIDYCCHGNMTLKEACGSDLLKLRSLEHDLQEVLYYDIRHAGFDYNTMTAPQLIEHIVNKHHRYVKETMPEITAHLLKVSSKHGERHPELHEIFKEFAILSDAFGQHMYKEEHVLFPRIVEIAEAADKKKLIPEHEKSYLIAPIHVMQSEHEEAGTIMHKIRNLTDHFTPPEDACTTYRLVYNELNEFELDLHRHVHLENNILFPKALQAFKQLNTETSLN